jgi:putative addiction module component (TIGR02574 family)
MDFGLHRPTLLGMLVPGIAYLRGAVMPVSLETLGIDQLSVEERLELIEQIWNSLPERVAPSEVPAWHLAELARRRAEVEARPAVGKPWREVLESLEARS